MWGHTGSWGTPELGLSEMLGDLMGKPRTSQGGSNVLGASTKVTPTKQPTTNKPITGGTTGSGGSSSQGVTNQPANGGYNPDAARSEQGDIEAARRAEMEAQERSAISSEFEPVFAELDRRIGLLPEQKKDFEGQIGNLATSQQKTVEENKTRELGTLSGQETEEYDQAKGSFRELEEDVRNHLLAKSFYFGALGAGDSSATGMASEAITKGSLKARSAVISTRDKALSTIRSKKAEVESLASSETRKIDEWKSNKLFETAQFFATKLDELQGQKVGANVEKARAITNMIRGLNGQFMQRLQQLDDQVTNFKQGVATWQMQRAADLEDYEKKLGIAAKYSSTSGSTQADVLNNFSKVYGTGAFSVAQARALATGQTDLTGLEMAPEELTKKKQSFEDQLLEQASQQSGSQGIGQLLGL